MKGREKLGQKMIILVYHFDEGHLAILKDGFKSVTLTFSSDMSEIPLSVIRMVVSVEDRFPELTM